MAANGAVQRPYTVSDEPRELTDEDLQFLAQYTGVADPARLREHVLNVWRTSKAKLWVYKCIQEFMFLHPRIAAHPHYPAVVAAARESGAACPPHVDVGTCFGQDTRKLLLDGYPVASLVAVDLLPDYWQLGKQLFMDADKLAVAEHWGSLTGQAFLRSTGLLGHAGYVWAGAVLHVLSQNDVERFLAGAAALLRPGGVFYGSTCGRSQAGEWAPTPDGKATRYLHNEETLSAALHAGGFSRVEVAQATRPWAGCKGMDDIRAQMERDAQQGGGAEAGRMLYLDFTAHK